MPLYSWDMAFQVPHANRQHIALKDEWFNGTLGAFIRHLHDNNLLMLKKGKLLLRMTFNQAIDNDKAKREDSAEEEKKLLAAVADFRHGEEPLACGAHVTGKHSRASTDSDDSKSFFCSYFKEYLS